MNLPSCEKIIDGEYINDNIANKNFDYVDNIICLKTKIDGSGFRIEIVNNSKENLKIQWDDAVYIDYNNRSHTVAKGGLKEITKDLYHAPSIIARGSRISELIVQTDYVIPLMNKCPDEKFDEAYNCAKLQIGQSCSLVIPVVFGETKVEYKVIYRLTGAYITKFFETKAIERTQVTP
jgi:hypothetical protein